MESKRNTSPKTKGKKFEKGDTESFASKAALPTEFANVPELILRKDQPSPNWSTFKQMMYEGATEKQYGDEALLFMQNDWIDVPMPRRPTKAELDADDTGLLQAEYLQDLKVAKDARTKATERRKSLYGIVRKAIPKDDWNVLIGTPNFHKNIELK